MYQLRKNNHYVPKLYLKQWAKDGQILTYRLLVPTNKVPQWKMQSLAGIAYHEHLYTYLGRDGETDEFERWLNDQFENPAERVIDCVVNERRIAAEDWNILTRFAIAQDVRTPAAMRAFFSRQNANLPDLVNETLSNSIKELEIFQKTGNRVLPVNQPIELFPGKVKVDQNPDGYGTIRAEIFIGRRLWLWQIRHLLTHTINKLPPYRWTVLHAPAGMTWPTSDNPFIRLNFKSSVQYDFKGGWAVNNGDLILPLSPTHLLHTCIGRKPLPRGTTLDIQTAQLLKKIILEHADRYVFATERSDIVALRPRTVCLDTYNRERSIWSNWRNDQCEAECGLD